MAISVHLLSLRTQRHQDEAGQWEQVPDPPWQGGVESALAALLVEALPEDEA